MTQRFILTNVGITTGGTNLVHGLTSDRGATPVVPTEWGWNKAGVGLAVEGNIYRNGAATTGVLPIAAGSATVVADVFISFQHSTIR